MMADLEQRVAALEEVVRKWGEILVARGAITINDARGALGLPEWTGVWADTAQVLSGEKP